VHSAHRFRGERESRALDGAVKPSRVGSPGRARHRGGAGAPIAGKGSSELALWTSGARQQSDLETAYGCVRGSCWSHVRQRACDMKNLDPALPTRRTTVFAYVVGPARVSKRRGSGGAVFAAVVGPAAW
jgi:hypothetical protein